MKEVREIVNLEDDAIGPVTCLREMYKVLSSIEDLLIFICNALDDMKCTDKE
jgi:hypothetical protein